MTAELQEFSLILCVKWGYVSMHWYDNTIKTAKFKLHLNALTKWD
jgi:hypothetical protein